MAEGKPLTYRDAGVDIGAADRMLADVTAAVRRTHTPNVLKTLADFGGLYALGQYRDPVLVSGTDGVGTKLKLAFAMDRHDTIGQDLVAMCVDDIVCQGARPLFFLDYLGTGRLQPETGAAVIRGIAAACEQVGCALIGGETAELPGFYADGEYDLAGFAVGVVERDEIIDGSVVREGDVILGLQSSGLHSNGYSLARKALLDVGGLGLDLPVPEVGRALGEELLEPTRLYAQHLVALLDSGLRPHGLVHITGGGWPGNIPRVIPEGLCATCDPAKVPVPPVMGLIQRLGDVATEEMYRTFNMGIGMVLVLDETDAARCEAFLGGRGLASYRLGRVTPAAEKFRFARGVAS
jgi:phosphoribosylformylglycinamidine cyclo-ligase